ncbi:hypothetical protein ACHAW5_009728 [Stephanodiscus triporus]|uniref:Uncharacterized protein n=1 Tax=Stephanodiscus triporus TaxID=2934178 RepID=A0ABD3QR30_9STRA
MSTIASHLLRRVVASTAAARPEIRKAATSSAAAANNNNGKNSKNSNNSDERWLENFNLLRPCIARDGSVDYSVLDDDDDEGGTLRRRIRNFAKEQRRRYSRLVVDDGDGDGDRDDHGGRSGTADERLRLLTEAGFDFRPSETNKARARGQRRAKAITIPPSGTNAGDGGYVATSREGDDCLRDTDDEEEEDRKREDGAMAVTGAKMTAAKKRKGEATAVTRRRKDERGNATMRAAKKKSDIALEGRDDRGSLSLGQTDDDNDNDDDGRRLQRTIQVLPPRVLAIDNRVLPTPLGDSMARSSFLRYIPDLVRDGLERGVLSSVSTASGALNANVGSSTIVASLGTREASRRVEKVIETKGAGGASVRTSVVPRVSYLFERDDGKAMSDDEQSSWLADLLRPINVEFGGRDGTADDDDDIRRNSDRFNPPCGFAAEDSWSYFGDLVEAIEIKLSRSPKNACSRARPVTLLTTDANLLADASSSSHVSGLEQFWKRIRTAFGNAVSTITIVVVDTTSVMHTMKTIKKCRDSYESTRPFEDKGCTLHATSLPSPLHVIQCLNDIRRRIKELCQSQDVQSTHMTTTPIKLNLEFIEGNTISFLSLLQAWMKESFDQTYSSFWSGVGGAGVQGRLSFDLPETLDGVMCSISLDLQYTLLPTCIHSSATKALVEEMHLFSTLSSSSVEVLQTIPLSSVDSSLIFGVPMSARASLENDICRYNEMKMLARQLWTYLSRNDMALVLLVRPLTKEGLDGTNFASSSCSRYPREQLFLLACEEVVKRQPHALDNESNLDPESFQIIPDKSRQGKSPCNGMLYRYATKSQLLRFGNEDERFEADEEDTTEMSDFYLDYIERSLDTFIKTGLNPLLMG